MLKDAACLRSCSVPFVERLSSTQDPGPINAMRIYSQCAGAETERDHLVHTNELNRKAKHSNHHQIATEYRAIADAGATPVNQYGGDKAPRNRKPRKAVLGGRGQLVGGIPPECDYSW